MNPSVLPFPALDNLTVAEQRELWMRCLKQVDALTLEAYINAVAEPESAGDQAVYEKRVKYQARLRRAYQEWCASLPDDSESAEA